MLSRTIRRSMITLATATAALASASIAEAGMVHANLGGSKIGTTQSTPRLPQVQARPQMIDSKLKVMHCYHVRERNEMGIYVTRKHCY